MDKYRVNTNALKRAHQLIDDGRYDADSSWSGAAPSTEAANRFLERYGYDGFGEWFLGIDTEASEETKDRYGFPYGDFHRVVRAALIHAKQRAAQNDHEAIEKAADELLQRLDERRAA